MGTVEFNDFTLEVISAIDDRINVALEEVCGEIQSQVQRSIPKDYIDDTPRTSWDHVVDKANHTGYVGSNAEAAFWEEFGTGSFAEKGNGRKGYWIYVKGSRGKTSNGGKVYTLKEAKQAMAILRSKGLDAYYTKGKPPRRPLRNAFAKKRTWAINHLQNRMRDL